MQLRVDCIVANGAAERTEDLRDPSPPSAREPAARGGDDRSCLDRPPDGVTPYCYIMADG